MDWLPLDADKFKRISELIDYNGKSMKTSTLYQRMSDISCDLNDKVKFILMHWGWDGAPKKEAKFILSKINDVGFLIPPNIENFFEQLYGLMLPMKKLRPEDVYGGTLRFKFPEKGWKDLLIGAECLSVKFHEDIIPIGDMLNYNGYSSSGQQIDGWENPNYKACGAWSYELHLGSSGKVYVWDTEISDYIGIAAEDLMSFFASTFGLIPDTEKKCGYTDDTDIKLMDRIEELWNEGRYKQYYFRKEVDSNVI